MQKDKRLPPIRVSCETLEKIAWLRTCGPAQCSTAAIVIAAIDKLYEETTKVGAHHD